MFEISVRFYVRGIIYVGREELSKDIDTTSLNYRQKPDESSELWRREVGDWENLHRIDIGNRSHPVTFTMTQDNRM